MIVGSGGRGRTFVARGKAALRRVFGGEWVRTGDTYVRSADGYFSSLGRTDDIIKAGGIWVSPTEVEQRLTTHPDVSQVVVVSVPDTQGLDKPVACVVLAAEATTSPEDLIAFCRDGLATFKRPRTVLVFDQLPTTATGKLQRFRIRELALERLGGSAADDRDLKPAPESIT